MAPTPVKIRSVTVQTDHGFVQVNVADDDHAYEVRASKDLVMGSNIRDLSVLIAAAMRAAHTDTSRRQIPRGRTIAAIKAEAPNP